jgi:hypothetical protein
MLRINRSCEKLAFFVGIYYCLVVLVFYNFVLSVSYLLNGLK